MQALKRRFALAAWVGLLVLVGCGGQSNPAGCAAENWRWRNPLPQGNYLIGVWGSGASDVWAVGTAGTILERGP